jgi:hypothetical protein
MSIPTVEYRGYALRAYAQKLFPTYHDPYASGRKEFTSVVMIDTIPSGLGSSRRYATVFQGRRPTESGDALDLAMQFGKDIIDGRINPHCI